MVSSPAADLGEAALDEGPFGGARVELQGCLVGVDSVGVASEAVQQVGAGDMATAIAQLASWTGLGSYRSSSPYRAATSRQLVSAAAEAVEWQAAMAA